MSIFQCLTIPNAQVRQRNAIASKGVLAAALACSGGLAVISWSSMSVSADDLTPHTVQEDVGNGGAGDPEQTSPDPPPQIIGDWVNYMPWSVAKKKFTQPDLALLDAALNLANHGRLVRQRATPTGSANQPPPFFKTPVFQFQFGDITAMNAARPSLLR